MAKNEFNFDGIRRQLLKTDISLDLANTVKNEAVTNFNRQGYDGKKWQEVQRRVPTTRTYKYAKKSSRSRAILVQSGRLRRDVANSVSAGKKNNNWSYTLVVNNPYAEAHNSGTNRLPERRFLGITPDLNKRLLQKINQRLKEAWAT